MQLNVNSLPVLLVHKQHLTVLSIGCSATLFDFMFGYHESRVKQTQFFWQKHFTLQYKTESIDCRS